MKREALVFYSPTDDPTAWRDALAAELPDLDFRLSAQPGDTSEIHYALVWKPPTGFFAPYPHLRLVTNLGAGVDEIVGRNDLPDVPICRLSDPGMVQLMTSYVLFAVLRYARDIPSFERSKARGKWEFIHPRPFAEIKVGLLGLGDLGAAAATALANLGFTVSGWSRTQKQLAHVNCVSGAGALDGFLAANEILVCMLPLTPETHGLLDKRRLALLPEGAKLINVSRGQVVDEAAMIEALRSRRIAEATLDVFVKEPLPEGHPLWALDNVLITPHLASNTTPAIAARDVAESIRRIRRGEEPLHRVDPKRGY
ncbi:glyoxylate/hydroxypyruvate reductase A [Nordella sp. HKS 07]|uniref:2-hydroxyacid dehydrogenase n=1 Tax=Nordella sp. HKS 07 TaxID=2712222 RepID=UPI0013E131A7|nr:glyoxylate/hydroxypyruvate reductase A [Nordella sp. HKS 07]QIG52327.1 glyoxylate/hydroxypyruvate reductase A [Nordella sp. HKS 07]